MRISTSVAHVLNAAAAMSLLAGCSGGSSQVAPSTNPDGIQSELFSRFHVTPTGRDNRTKSWMKLPSVLTRLTYVADSAAGVVTVFGRNAVIQGQITGLTGPGGLFVDSDRNLWVANFNPSSGSDVLEFARGGTSPIKTLSDTGGNPIDVTICPSGTVYVSNLGEGSTPGIAVYASGNTEPTGTLTYPGDVVNLYVTCDAAGNVFSLIFTSSGGRVVEYPGGSQSGARDLGIALSAPDGIKPDNAGNLLIVDSGTVTEYTEAGAPTGNSISTGSDEIVDLAVTRDSRVVGGASSNLRGISWTFPAGVQRQIYTTSKPINLSGFAFDPGQKGL